MQATKAMVRLSHSDLTLIRRDSALVYFLVYSVGSAVLLRFVLPLLNVYFAERHILSFPLSDIYPMFFVWTAILLGAGLPGVIFGFLLLDNKDQGTLKALLVTPLPFRLYVANRIITVTLIAFFLVIADILIAGVALPPLWQLVILAAGASFFAPIMALFFAAFAENRVQGFALARFPGVTSILLTIAWYIHAPVQFLFGLLPPFWVVKAYWLALEGNSLWVASLALGIVFQLAVILALAKRFRKVAYN